MAPGKDGALFAIADGKVLRSQDRGANWSYNDNYLDKARARCLAIHPHDPSQILVGLTVGIYKSKDGRQSWYPSSQGLAQASVAALAYNPLKTETIYAGIDRSVYRSSDQGESWGLAGRIEEKPATNILALLTDPRDPLLLYASAGGGGLFRTSDGGQTWRLLDTLPSAWVTALDLAAKEPSTLYAGTLEGKAYRSTDGGLTWLKSDAGLRDIAIKALAVDPEHPSDVYLGTWGDGLYVMRNWEQGWRKVETDFQYVTRLLVDARAWRRNIYALTEKGAYRGSYDERGALAWQWYLGPLSDLILGAANDRELIVASHASRTQLEGAAANPDIVVMSDAGSSGGGAIRLLVQGSSLPRTLYAALESGEVWRSHDLGETWENTGNGLEGRRINMLVIHPATQTLYAGTDQGVYYLAP